MNPRKERNNRIVEQVFKEVRRGNTYTRAFEIVSLELFRRGIILAPGSVRNIFYASVGGVRASEK